MRCHITFVSELDGCLLLWCGCLQPKIGKWSLCAGAMVRSFVCGVGSSIPTEYCYVKCFIFVRVLINESM